MNEANGKRKWLDAWFPTIVRYGGIVLLIYLIVEHVDHPGLITLAAGMIMFKSIYGGGPPEAK